MVKRETARFDLFDLLALRGVYAGITFCGRCSTWCGLFKIFVTAAILAKGHVSLFVIGAVGGG